MSSTSKDGQVTQNAIDHGDLASTDPDVFQLLRNEKKRQRSSLNLTASENYVSKAVQDALSSSIGNKYSESQAKVQNRYYGGNQYSDELELLVMKRALQVFNLCEEQWGVNIHHLSGSAANLAAITALVEPHGRIMALKSDDGGHPTHGYMTGGKKVTATSIFFETLPFRVNPATNLIDFDRLRETAKEFGPKLIIAGISCYSRHLDYARFRAIADENEALLMADMAHVSGLVAAGLAANPFDHCDVVTTTTHKTLRGPRAGLVFYRKGIRKYGNKTEQYTLEEKIFNSTYHGCLGGHHNNLLAAVAVSLKEAATNDFKQYQEQTLANARALCLALQHKGYKIITDGTDNHMMLIDLRNKHVNASNVQVVMEEIGIFLNALACPWEENTTSALRVGTPALTSRNLRETDMEKVAEYLHQGIQLTITIQQQITKDNEFLVKLSSEDVKRDLKTLRCEVEQFMALWPIPGDCTI